MLLHRQYKNFPQTFIYKRIVPFKYDFSSSKYKKNKKTLLKILDKYAPLKKKYLTLFAMRGQILPLLQIFEIV